MRKMANMIPTVNLTRFILKQATKHPESTGELSELLSAVALGVKLIRDLVSTAGFKGLHGYTGKTNVQGEVTHILDQSSDEILVEILSSSGHFGLLVSEERETVIRVSEERGSAKYVLAFDPLDGSSNLGSNIPVGTIFAVYRKKEIQGAPTEKDFQQPGRNLVAAGYAIYGARTSFVYSTGQGVHEFTLDPSIGEFLLTDADVRTPTKGATYSTNEGNSLNWSAATQKFVAAMKAEDATQGTPYSARYVGSLVADFDRNLKRGGVFLYPADKKSPKGKLRLLYECIPLAFIAEQAGGRATNGIENILDIVPSDIHQRSPLVIGSRFEVDWFEKLCRQEKNQ